jgi:hypothetical protein
MSGGLPSLSSYTHSSGGYVNHYSTGSDPFVKARRKTKTAKYNAAAKAAAAREAAAHHDSVIGSILGVAGNLLHDTKDMAFGAIPGAIHAVEHPIAAGKALGQDYKTRYGKILNGDFSDISKHPLSYILDAATIASGGLGAAAKVGQVGKVAEAAAAGSRSAKFLNDMGKAKTTSIALKRGEAKSVPVSLSSRPYVRARQRALLKLQELPGVSKTPVFGSEAKARRTTIGNQRNAEAAFRKTQPAYERAIKKLTTATQVHVFDIISRGTEAGHELGFYRHHTIEPHLADESKDLLKHLEQPETHKLYTEVTTHFKTGDGDPFVRSTQKLSPEAQPVVEALKQHQKLTDQAAKHLIKAGKKTAQGLADRRVLHLRIQDEVKIHDLQHEVKRLTGVHSSAVERAARLVDKDSDVARLTSMLSAAHAGKLATSIDKAAMTRESKKLAARVARAHGKVEDMVIEHPLVKAAVANVAMLHVLRTAHNTHLPTAVAENFLPGIAQTVKGAHHLDETVLPKAEQSVLDVAEQVRAGLRQERVHPLEDRQALHELLLGDHQEFPDKVIGELERQLQGAHERAHGRLVGKHVSPVENAIKDAQDEIDHLTNKKTGDYLREAKARTGILPQYTADKMILADAKSGVLKQNKGTLYRAGDRHPNPEIALVRHEQAANIASVQHAHGTMKAVGIHRPDGKLGKGEVWVREDDPSKDFIGVNLERFGKETQPLIESAMQAVSKEKGIDPREMYFDSLTQTMPPTKPENRIAVPKVLAQDMIERHVRIHGTMSDMLHKATSLWKGAVLAYRPAFITNNVIGNQTLYHLRHGFGPRAIAALGALKRDRAAFEDLLNEHNATFGHAERFLSDSKAAKVGNLGYRVVGAHELWLRVATMRRHALTIPEVRAEMRALKGGKYDPAKNGGRTMFHEALRRAIGKNHAIRDEISSVIDDTMGNYRYYNRFEEGLRQLIPFYGWNRHAVRSFERLLADRPAFAQMIAEVSHEGNKQQGKDFPGTPDFMKSYLKTHLPGGINAIDTRGLNPMLAATDTVESAKQALNMKPGEMDKTLSVINPLIMDAIQSATHSNLTTGAPLPKTAFDNLPAGELLGQIIEGLPQVRIGSHLAGSDQPDKNSDRYNLTPTGRPAKHKTPMLTHSNVDLIASLLGAPVKDVNLPAAQAFQKKIDATKQPHFHASNPRKKKPKRIKF